MSDLHLVQLPISLARLHEWGERRGLSRRGFLDEGAALHHLVGECFGAGVLQPFRLKAGKGGGHSTLFAYSKWTAEKLADEASSVITPDVSDAIDLSALQSLPRPSSAWRAGQRLGFDVRLRPVVRLRKSIEHDDKRFTEGAEVDAWLVHRLNGGTETREALYLDWLEARLDRVATLERATTRMEKFQRNKVLRGGRLLEGPEAVLFGTLSIVDTTGFSAKLAGGVGRHKSYGYGMLLLRPPQRAC